jgi:hypothetical protein
MPGSSAWDKWEKLRKSPDPDPIEVLKAVAVFQKYFATVEKEAVKVARSQNRTWQEIGTALGRTRQALWQRAASRGTETQSAHWDEIWRNLDDSWAQTAEVRHNVGMAPQ